MAFFPVMCYHCGSPACIPACPENAINKSEKTGIVTVNTAACIGGKKCGLCLEACPYGIPEFDPSAEGVMRKCDLCESRWSEGRKPVCVEACPVLALDAGPLGTLIEKHGAVRDAEGYITVGDLSPSIVCKPRRDARNLPLVKETVVPRRRD
jgi:anaerobic dimethyl sulfoxide reductase subunit B (iron-sulfur subunit)